MSSASPRAATPDPASREPDSAVFGEDRTARARIRDAAIRLFGEGGFDATTVRAIAEAADVSPALVVHHFESKQGLRDAAEEHLLAMVRAGKFAAMTGSLVPSADEYADLAAEYVPAMTYLARSLAEGGDLGHALYRRLHADAVDYLDAGVEAGLLEPSDDPRARAAVLLNVGLGHLLLMDHVRRVLGVDDDLQTALRTAPIMLDLYTDGLFTDDRFRAAWQAQNEPTPPEATPTSTPTTPTPTTSAPPSPTHDTPTRDATSKAGP